MASKMHWAALFPPLMVTSFCPAQSQVSEYQAKIVLIEKLTRFVEWPNGGLPGKAFRLAVIGRTPFGDALEDYFASHPIKNLPVSVEYYTDPGDIRSCDLLFVAHSETGTLDAILSRVKARPILTIADTPGFTRRGVMVNIIREGARMTFEVNLDPVRESNLRMHPGFLQLARIIGHN
ncbi:MAG: hypothetical protein H6Q00_2954 [Holophagaceae bacterium]|nr:hypothetical protein [Holophagaceae bacterium]